MRSHRRNVLPRRNIMQIVAVEPWAARLPDPVPDYDPFDELPEESNPAANTDDYTDYTAKPAKENKAPANVQPSSSGDDAAYLVVAGSFLLEENANRMKNKLIGMGYTAEVRNFNFSQYYSVIAGRYMDRSSADALAAKLKAKGIDCLVHKRKY